MRCVINNTVCNMSCITYMLANKTLVKFYKNTQEPELISVHKGGNFSISDFIWCSPCSSPIQNKIPKAISNLQKPEAKRLVSHKWYM